MAVFWTESPVTQTALVLVKADGTIQTKTTDTLKAVFGWDGVDPFWLMDSSLDGGAMRDVEFEIVGGPETGDKGGQYFKSQWLNPLGGGMKTPAAADRRSVLAKYGSKFQALAGVGKVQSPESKVQSPPKAPTAPRAAQPPPPPGAPTATMEEAWAALNDANTGKPAEAIEKLWFDTIARLWDHIADTGIGFCLDTCHAWAAGEELVDSVERMLHTRLLDGLWNRLGDGYHGFGLGSRAPQPEPAGHDRGQHQRDHGKHPAGPAPALDFGLTVLRFKVLAFVAHAALVRFRWTRSSEIAAGVTPGTRAAWPSVCGRASPRRWRTSFDRPVTRA